MEQIFFIILTSISVVLFLMSFWFKKPLLGVFAGILIMLVGLMCLQGVSVHTGTNSTSISTFNATYSNETIVVANNYTNRSDTTSFLVYVLIGLAILFMSSIEFFNNSKPSLPGKDDED